MKKVIDNYAGQLIALAFFVTLFFIGFAITAQDVAHNNVDAETHIQAYNIHESTTAMNEMDIIYNVIELINRLEEMIEWTQFDIVDGEVSGRVGQDNIEQYQGMINLLRSMLYERRED